jgi:hypothetical protein
VFWITKILQKSMQRDYPKTPSIRQLYRVFWTHKIFAKMLANGLTQPCHLVILPVLDTQFFCKKACKPYKTVQPLLSSAQLNSLPFFVAFLLDLHLAIPELL